ncbi:MAG: preprotein translocase subunit SecG [Bacteroidota bacterium]
MVILLIILLIILSIALGLFVLIQDPKGGGLTTGGSGSNMFGVKRTGDVLEKGTWVLLTLIVVISMALTTIGKTGGAASANESKIAPLINKTATPSPIGSGASTTAPATAPKSGDTSKK